MMALSAQQFEGGEQLRLFMPAREIMDRFAPHEGDRMYAGKGIYVHQQPALAQYGDQDPRAGTPTRRSHRTDGAINDPAGPGIYYRSRERLAEPIRPETNDELWERKRQEAESTGLGEDLREHGVHSPVPLTTDRMTKNSREMIGGGQHRIAVMAHDRPEELVPVVWHSDIRAAQAGGRYWPYY